MNGSKNAEIFGKYSKTFLGKIGKVEGEANLSMSPRRVYVAQITGTWQADSARLERFKRSLDETALLVSVVVQRESGTGGADSEVIFPREFQGMPVYYITLQ
jgi:hypothetical protein